jgi:hypothetical protein
MTLRVGSGDGQPRSLRTAAVRPATQASGLYFFELPISQIISDLAYATNSVPSP